VFDAVSVIMEEYDRAEKKWNENYHHDADQPVEFWITHMQRYLTKATQSSGGWDKTEALRNIVKVASLAITCLSYNPVDMED